MDIRIFDPPEAGEPRFRSTGRATGASAVTLVERLYEPGWFELEIPFQARHAEQLEIGRLVRIEAPGGALGDETAAGMARFGGLWTSWNCRQAAAGSA